MSSYISGFSDLIEQYEKYQKASDSWSDHAHGLNIRYFDRYCALHYPGQPLCQEMVDEWCRKRETKPILPVLQELAVSVLLFAICGTED